MPAAPLGVPSMTAAPLGVPSMTAAPLGVPSMTAAPLGVPSMTAAPVAGPPATAPPLAAQPLPQTLAAQPLAAQPLAAQPLAAGALAAQPLAAQPAAVPAMAADSSGGTDGRQAGRIHQSVLTGNIRSVAEVKLAALGLREWLDLCIGAYGDDHEDRTELVEVARRRAAAVHGRSAAAFGGTATVVIGDTPLDISAALAAGARAVGVATGSYSADDLAMAGADAVLPDLTDTATVLRALLP
jgi:phosphoglycolate phosphatase-like HAD superfamily hydrolase